MLPPDFHWYSRQHGDDGELELRCGGRVVAMLMRRVDGSWYAMLDAHRDINAPLVMRACTTRDSGRAGIEAWAMRHSTRLRQEVGGARTFPTG